MNAELYARAEVVFTAACKLPPSEREAFVQQSCGDDLECQRTVLALLAADPGESRYAASPDHARATENASAERTAGARLHDLAGAFAPEHIRDYRVLDVLGVGGSGVVLRARQPGLDRDVAIKLLHEEHVDEHVARRFAVEAHVLGSLDHPGIVRILESGSAPSHTGERPFFVMELVDGLPITQFVREHRLDTHACLALLIDVADAVHHAHQRGVVHRDLKPANLLVTEAGRPRILDFGLARSLRRGQGMTTLDGGADAVLGTFGYMSPEQRRGELARVDMRSDVFSLGAIAHELLSLAARTDDDSAPRPPRPPRPLDAPFEPLGRSHPSLRGDIESVVAKAVAEEPTKRYASAAEFAADLRALLRGQAVSARRPSELETLWRNLRQHPRLTASVLSIMLALAVGLSVQSAAVTRNRQEAERLQALFEQLAILLNDPHPNADGEIVPVSEVSVREKFASAGSFVEDLAERDPSAAGGISMMAGRVLGALGNSAEDRERSREFIERGVELLSEGSGPAHPQTLDARRDLVAAAAFDRETDKALRLLAELERDAAGLLDDAPELRLQLAAARERLAFQSGKSDTAELASILSQATHELGPEHNFTLYTLLDLAGRSPAEHGLELLAEQADRLAELGRPRMAWRARLVEGRLLAKLATDRGDRERFQQALDTLESAAQLAETLFGVASSPAVNTRERLALAREDWHATHSTSPTSLD
ncbi:MAG: hypothetical protein DHS20C15_05460 [Planctomycetota bacterium]|nr:MAG: hypothetical protein DHS20C15_05460 [Planctomycetota bacterium]